MAGDDLTDSHNQTYYELLGLPNSAQLSLQDIKSAYRQALLNTHPDKVSTTNSSGVNVDLVRKAWEVLSDNALRKEYDAKIKGMSSIRSRCLYG
jgi:DnaJ-class molecular chaperone